jgi:hypothetical protein
LAVFRHEQFEKLLNCGGMQILQHIILEHICPVFIGYSNRGVTIKQYHSADSEEIY